MKYSEMLKFLSDNNIKIMQPVIAGEVSSQLEVDITDGEFEAICEAIYQTYLDCFDEPDIWELVDEKLVNRGYKE